MRCTHHHGWKCGCYECSAPDHRLEHEWEETLCLSAVDDTGFTAKAIKTECSEVRGMMAITDLLPTEHNPELCYAGDLTSIEY